MYNRFRRLAKKPEKGPFVIVVNNVQTRLGEPENAAVLQALKRLGLSEKQVQDAYVSKTSLDARKQTDIPAGAYSHYPPVW